jgi:hypothetical protein
LVFDIDGVGTVGGHLEDIGGRQRGTCPVPFLQYT